MSFILDALKKSEERRRLHEETRKPGHKILDLSWSGSRRWPVWLLLAVLSAALACGWWLRGATLQPAAEDQWPAVDSNRQSAPAVAADTRMDPPPAPFAPVPAGSLAEPPKLAPGATRAAADAAVSPPAQALSVARPRPIASTIPAALRDRKSKLTMTLHFYTDEPARRMVRIDDRIVREGQVVADQLVLEEITPDGAIFAFAGERFAVRGPGTQPGEN